MSNQTRGLSIAVEREGERLFSLGPDNTILLPTAQPELEEAKAVLEDALCEVLTAMRQYSPSATVTETDDNWPESEPNPAAHNSGKIVPLVAPQGNPNTA